MEHRVAVVTSTRAEYGLLRPVLHKIEQTSGLSLCLIVTGAHLQGRFGNTVKEIEADGLPIAYRTEIFLEEPEPVGQTIARTIQTFDELFAKDPPDCVVLLGDRFEIFAVATAAAANRIPIAHISGGDVTLGAADEYYRHCITKMAALHFPSCQDSAARLLRMGEPPERVFCVGGLGDENIRTLPKLSARQLKDSTGFPFDRPYGMVTYHPETAGPGAADAAEQARRLAQALAAVPQVFWVITGSNADEGGAICTAVMQQFANEHPLQAGFINSLGALRYLSAMSRAAVVVGNSSSGVVETPSFGVPTVNIGSRQQGRIVCDNVLNCPAECAAITAAIQKALSPEFIRQARKVVSPYYGGDTSGRIVRQLKQSLDEGFAVKSFYDA